MSKHFIVFFYNFDNDKDLSYRYNTVEHFVNVNHTAVLKLFLNPELFTACRSNYTCLRRSTRVHALHALQCQQEISPTIYERTISSLLSLLQIEERDGRYSFELGFIS